MKFARPGYLDRLSNEARAALRITHENISRIYEIHSADTGQGTADFISRLAGERRRAAAEAGASHGVRRI